MASDSPSGGDLERQTLPLHLLRVQMTGLGLRTQFIILQGWNSGFHAFDNSTASVTSQSLLSVTQKKLYF